MYRAGLKSLRVTASTRISKCCYTEGTRRATKTPKRRKSDASPTKDTTNTRHNSDATTKPSKRPLRCVAINKKSNTVQIQDTEFQTSRDSTPKPIRPATPKPRKFSEDTIYTSKYILKNLEVPSASQYGFSYNLDLEFPRLLQNSGLGIKYQLGKLRSKFAKNSANTWCSLHIQLNDGRALDVKGHGLNVEEAQAAADMHALCRLHKMGVLQEFLAVNNPDSEYLDPGPQKLRREASAKIDIINYAARHDCVPKFTFRKIHSAKQISSRIKGQQSRKDQRSMFRAHASIPELGLNGYGRGIDAQHAVLAASLSLKHAAEARHAATGEGTLLIQDYTNLTTHSGVKFVYFYCLHQHLECNTVFDESSVSDVGGSWAMKVILRSPESQQARNDISILKRSQRPLFDTSAWPGISRADVIPEKTFQSIPMAGKQDAEAVGYLMAALGLKKESPLLWDQFLKEMKRGSGDLLKPLRPIDFEFGPKTMTIVNRTLQEAGSAMRETDPTVDVPVETIDRNSERFRQFDDGELQQKNEQLRRRLDLYETHPSLTELRRLQLELPLSQARNQILEMIGHNDVCVVVGATGSGKTTQLPQLILDDIIRQGSGASCNIICTQPRRIAAISVARRVAVERNERLGNSVGYSVRFDGRPPEPGGSIHYLTTGVLLKQIQEDRDQALAGVSHILVDEVHERDLNNDFLLVILKNLLEDRRAAGRPPIKIILMSATIDTTLFCKYFGDWYPDNMCPLIKVPGRTFPVTSHFLEDIHLQLRSTYPVHEAMELYSRHSDDYVSGELELDNSSASRSRARPSEDTEVDGSDHSRSIINWTSKGVIDDDGEVNFAVNKHDTFTPVGLMSVTIAHILKTTTEGSILVFLPGLPEIVALEKLLKQTKPLGIDFGNNPNYKVYVLHSSLPNMQQEVFAKVGPRRRKIILATNVAETSVTIPDVMYVVDSSKQREMQYDKTRRISALVSTWTAKSNAQQRAGRAGRVQHGHYYTMATRARYDSFETASKPEILRIDLQTLCLQIKKMGVENIWEFLKRAIEPPSRSAVKSAIEELQALRALDKDESLTPLGRYLSALPLAPSIGKMVVLASIFRCLDPILILAAASSAKSPFLNPLSLRDEAEKCRAKWAMGTGSDQAAIINAFQEWRRLRRIGRGSWQPDRQFARDNFLHHETLCNMVRIADQLVDVLQSSGLVEPPMQSANGIASQYGSDYENFYSDSQALQVALMTAGFYPNIAIRRKAGSARFLRTVHENEAAISPYSLAAPRPEDGKRYGKITDSSAAPPGTLFTFAEKTQGDDQGVFLRNVTRTFPLAVFLFGGRVLMQGAIITVDDWIPFYSRRHDRFPLQRFYTILQEFLRRTFEQLGADKPDRRATQRFLQQDKVRGPLVKGIVDALNDCTPTGLMKPKSGGMMDEGESTFDGQGQYKPHSPGDGREGFYDYSRFKSDREDPKRKVSGPSLKAKGKRTLLDLLQKSRK